MVSLLQLETRCTIKEKGLEEKIMKTNNKKTEWIKKHSIILVLTEQRKCY